VPRSAAFLGKFLLAAAVLFALWTLARASDGYGRAVLFVADPLMWLFSGFRVDAIAPTDAGLNVFIRKGADRLLLPLQPRELFSGVIPFVALILASHDLAVRARLRALALGVAALFAFHVGLMVLGPFLATPHEDWVNRIIDVTYGFYGLVGYAALPFLLWYALTRPADDIEPPVP
jgi:hypothetical protein